MLVCALESSGLDTKDFLGVDKTMHLGYNQLAFSWQISEVCFSEKIATCTCVQEFILREGKRVLRRYINCVVSLRRVMLLPVLCM